MLLLNGFCESDLVGDDPVYRAVYVFLEGFIRINGPDKHLMSCFLRMQDCQFLVRKIFHHIEIHLRVTKTAKLNRNHETSRDFRRFCLEFFHDFQIKRHDFVGVVDGEFFVFCDEKIYVVCRFTAMWLELDNKRHANFFGCFEKLFKSRNVTRESVLFDGKTVNFVKSHVLNAFIQAC